MDLTSGWTLARRAVLLVLVVALVVGVPLLLFDATGRVESVDPAWKDLAAYAASKNGDRSADADAVAALPRLNRAVGADGTETVTQRGTDGVCWMVQVRPGEVVASPAAADPAMCPVAGE